MEIPRRSKTKPEQRNMESFRLYVIRIKLALNQAYSLCRDDQNYMIRAKNFLRALALNLLDLDDKKKYARTGRNLLILDASGETQLF